MNNKFKFLLFLVIVTILFVSCGPAAQEAPVAEPAPGEPAEPSVPMSDLVVVLVVDAFSDVNNAQTQDGESNCLITPNGQKFRGGESATVPLGNPHGFYVYKDFIQELESLGEFTPKAREGDDFTGTQSFEDRGWFKRYDLYALSKNGERGLLSLAVDTDGLDLNRITQYISDAFELFSGSDTLRLGDTDLPKTDRFVVNMSFVLIPCDPDSVLKDNLQKLQDQFGIQGNAGIVQELKSRYDTDPAFKEEISTIPPLKSLKSRLEKLGYSAVVIDDAVFQAFIAYLVYDPNLGREWQITNFHDTLKRYFERGLEIVYVAAAGNFEDGFPYAPASWNFVVSASSYASQQEQNPQLLPDLALSDQLVDNNRSLAEYSNWGEIRDDGRLYGEDQPIIGTSFAAPKLSAKIAHYLVDGGKSPCPDNLEIQPFLGYGNNDIKQFPVWDGVHTEPYDNMTFDIAKDWYCPTSVSLQPAQAMDNKERIPIRWFVGLGPGTRDDQLAPQEEVVKKFNDSQNNIELKLEVVPYSEARDVLATQIASGDAPDIVGPVTWNRANAFHGQWMDLSNLMWESGYDTSDFNPAVIKTLETEEGQVGLPISVYPAAIIYRPKLFEQAGLYSPPSYYGERYVMPDGSEVDWSWDTMIYIARLLTVDAYGSNATDDHFDATQIVQYGYEPQWQSGRHMAAFFGGQKIYKDGVSTISWAARDAWSVYFDGMWGWQPFIPTGPVRSSFSFNTFGNGNVAMAITQSWYLDSANNLVDPGEPFDFGALPSYSSSIYGCVDTDTFRILQSTQYPKEAFEALSYLVGPASYELNLAYNTMSARTSDQDAWISTEKDKYPFVGNWYPFLDGLNYPDIPSAFGYLPNNAEANQRVQTFIDLISTDNTIDFDYEVDRLEEDLQTIYDNQ
jgi:multiple sugar transport system substrate-binding protein